MYSWLTWWFIKDWCSWQWIIQQLCAIDIMNKVILIVETSSKMLVSSAAEFSPHQKMITTLHLQRPPPLKAFISFSWVIFNTIQPNKFFSPSTKPRKERHKQLQEFLFYRQEVIQFQHYQRNIDSAFKWPDFIQESVSVVFTRPIAPLKGNYESSQQLWPSKNVTALSRYFSLEIPGFHSGATYFKDYIPSNSWLIELQF